MDKTKQKGKKQKRTKWIVDFDVKEKSPCRRKVYSFLSKPANRPSARSSQSVLIFNDAQTAKRVYAKVAKCDARVHLYRAKKKKPAKK